VEINEILANLNPAQRQAVETIYGPVLVIAGPGTGKTQVLAARIANILQNPDVQATPAQILCLTFTESGVGAMRERLASLIGDAAYKVQIHTFHSFCNKIIQDYPDKFPRFNGSPKQASQLAQLKILKQILEELDPAQKWQLRPANSRKDMYAKDILKAIQFLKREDILPAKLILGADEILKDLQVNPKLYVKGERKGQIHDDQLRAENAQRKNLELAHIYELYDQECRRQNLYDYDDMILEVVDRLHKDDQLAYEILEKLQFILVDEYQDTNGAQNKILEILGQLDPEQQPNIFAVGDDDQAIYSFQGANVENILFFQQKFPQTKTIVLTENYRSTQPILDLAMDSIGHNSQRLAAMSSAINKNLHAVGGQGLVSRGQSLGLDSQHFASSGQNFSSDAQNSAHSDQDLATKPQIFNFAHSDDELAWIVQQIQSLQAAGENLADIAIMYRTHADVKLLTHVLDKLGIANKLASPSNLLDEQVVLVIRQLLQVVAYTDLSRDNLLMQLLLRDFIQSAFSLSKTAVFSFLTKYHDQQKFGNPAYPIKTLMNLALELEPENGVHIFVEKLIEWQANFFNMPITEALIIMLDQTGLLRDVYGKAEKPDQIEAVNAFVKFVRDLNLSNVALTLTELLADIQLYVEEELTVPFRQPNLMQDAVNLLTVHAAKGLEYKYVFVIKLVDKHWNDRRSSDVFKNWPPQLFTAAAAENQNEEERRLFFVAVTRAKTQLYLSYAEAYQGEQSESVKKQGLFLVELSADVITRVDGSQITAEKKDFWQQLLRPKTVVIEQLEELEMAYLSGLLKDFKLSASALNEYLECPLKFKFNRLLKVPYISSPEITLGNALHKALELQAKQLMAGGQPDLKFAQVAFTASLQQELIARTDYELIHPEGLELLNQYYQKYAAVMTAPAGVEYDFGRHQIFLNLPDQEPIRLTGKIDKLEWIDKDRSAIRVIDYKASKPKSENEIKGETKNSTGNIWTQLVFYSLMAKLDDQFKPVNKLTKYQIEAMQVDFLKPEKGQLIRRDLVVTNEDEQELTTVITAVVGGIRRFDFNGSAEYPLCGKCEYCKRLGSIAG